MPRAYEIWDVFTDRPLSGNPLAVVFDAQGLNTAQMQAIAAEFNLSETSFVFPAEDPEHAARVRIFTPAYEMPFAGHPTVGTSLALAARTPSLGQFVLELNAGLFPIRLETVEGERRAVFSSPNRPRETGAAPSVAALARALSLAPDDIWKDAHGPRRCGAGGVDFFYVRASRQNVRKAQLDSAGWNALSLDGAIGIHLYTDECEEPGHHWHARMFAPSAGVAEDPATGSAATSLTAKILLSARASGSPLRDGNHHWVVEQGFEMNRPSLIHTSMTVADGEISSVEIGGQAVKVASGTLDL
ncbi:MAG: PhzF family phenazine biosynthesis protein [Pseudomonadota bacterium]